MTRLATRTLDAYSRHQHAFEKYCHDNGITLPAPVDAICVYLTHVAKVRGASLVPVAASAVAHWYRDHGLQLDMKGNELQAVLGEARELLYQSRMERRGLRR